MHLVLSSEHILKVNGVINSEHNLKVTLTALELSVHKVRVVVPALLDANFVSFYISNMFIQLTICFHGLRT